MNVSIAELEDVFADQASERWASTPSKSQDSGNNRRKTYGRRRGKSPQQFNGIHRRRRKKIRW
jgi:hypothetical protein